jgi:transposase-like protein
MMQGLLKQEGFSVGRLHVATLMKRMGIAAIYRRPNTSKPEPGHKIYPYLLRNVPILRPNQVWAMDITYIPMARGFAYLAAVIDWFSRKVLAWKLSITLDTGFCIEAVEEALAKYGKPEVFNTDQGSQFTRQMKTLVTRAGPGTKIVCLGNIAQIDTPYLTEGSSGLTYVVDRFKGWRHSGHITLARGERSRLADHAAEAL